MSDKMSVQELLEAGLHHYGLGETEKALAAWQEVLRLDPGNETASEFIEIETGRRPESAKQSGDEPAPEPILELGDEYIEPLAAAPALSEDFLAGQHFLNIAAPEQAILSFEAAHRAQPELAMYWAHVELARAKLIKEVLFLAGGLRRAIRLRVPLTHLTGAKMFTQEEGFVLSLITGDLGLEDVVALSPIPRFKTYEIIYRLFKEGLAEVGEEVR